MFKCMSSHDTSIEFCFSKVVTDMILFLKVSVNRILGSVSADMLSTEGMQTSEDAGYLES